MPYHAACLTTRLVVTFNARLWLQYIEQVY